MPLWALAAPLLKAYAAKNLGKGIGWFSRRKKAAIPTHSPAPQMQRFKTGIGRTPIVHPMSTTPSRNAPRMLPAPAQIATRMGRAGSTTNALIQTIIAAGGYVAGNWLFDSSGSKIKRVKSGGAGKGKGVNKRDILGANRVAKLVKSFGFKPKIQSRKKKGVGRC